MLVFVSKEYTCFCGTQIRCFVEHRSENRGEIARRRIDDLQDLGGRGLSGQCLVEPVLQLSVDSPNFG
jgi:hypothetical protein